MPNQKGKIWRVRDNITPGGAALSTELRGKGFYVDEFVFNPHKAHDVLSRESERGLAVIDVSLVPDENSDLYSTKRTDSGRFTGLYLAKDLMRKNRGRFPRNLMMMLSASEHTMTSWTTKGFCQTYDIPLIKEDECSVCEIADRIEGRYRELFGQGGSG